MVRAFGRKGEPGNTRPSVTEDSGWFDGSIPADSSPASLWGLNDGTHFRHENNTGESSAQESQSDQDWDRSEEHELILSRDESDWWSQPNLMDQSYEPGIMEETPETQDSPERNSMDHSYELTDEERPLDTLELPVLVLAAPDSNERYSTDAISEHETFASDEDDIDETTLVTNVPAFASAPPDEISDAYVDSTRAEEVADAHVSATASEQGQATIDLDDDAITIVPAAQEIKPARRVLNEASVLPHEASFATVSLYQPSARTYSPGKEFVTKFVSGVQRSFPVVLLVAVCAAVIFFSVKYKSRLFDSATNQPAQHLSSPKTPATTTAPVKSATETTSNNTERPAIEPSRTVETAGTPAEPKETRADNPADRKEVVREAVAPKSVPEKKALTPVAKSQTAVVKSQAVRPAVQRKLQPAASAENRPAKAKAETRSKVETPKAEAPKVEASVPATPTGGGERPRRVNPGSESSTPKP